MLPQLQTAVAELIERRDLSAELMEQAVRAIMEGSCQEGEIASFLTALRCKGEAVSELVGAARVMRDLATPIRCQRTGLLDTCGPGGDGRQTFNISTAASFVIAACGVPIAKHGNRSITSSSGSADVLEAMGVNLQLSPDQIARCVDDVGLGFCFAPLLHGAMKHAMPVRKQLGFRTIFNLLGPLTNPARATYQLVGCGKPDLAEKLARALSELGVRRAIVVSGAGQLGEVALWETTHVWHIRAGQPLATEQWTAGSFGFPECTIHDLTARNASESAAIIQQVLANEAGPARNMVVANAAAGLLAADRVESLAEGVANAEASLNTGTAAECLRKLIAVTNAVAT